MVRLPQGSGHLGQGGQTLAAQVAVCAAIAVFAGHIGQGAQIRPQGGKDTYDHRHTVGLSATRLCRFHIWIGEGESMVVQCVDADCVSLLCDRLRHCSDALDLYGSLAIAIQGSGHDLPEQTR